ncbi:tyrosine-type recombinase/integrase [Rhizobium sp. LjRoot254]|uniref:tyrosine-type recombinase/integrase n=1 Tax=Rhizobium sp. LjRoot254 TaxID=3342297 RepID=UPI003ECEE69D
MSKKEDRNPPGFQVWQDKKLPFKWRVRHRKTGETIDADKFPLYSMAFYAEAQRIVDRHKKAAAKPGTLGALIKAYRASDDFIDAEIGKARRTQADYQKVFDYLQPIDTTALTWFTTERVVKLRDKAFKNLRRKWANYVVTVLSIIFEWGKLRGFVKTNPAADIPAIKRPKSMLAANRPWQDAERDAVIAALPVHMRMPMAFMMYCGLDPSDAVKLPKNAVKNGMLDTRRGKTGVPVWIRLPAPLVDVMNAAPKHDAITACANSRGKPWTYNGFSTNWHKLKGKLIEQGLVQPGLTLKGLRHTVGSILAELGYDDRTIADMLGHETETMARHYSKRANRTRKMSAVVASFEDELNKRKTGNVKPD